MCRLSCLCALMSCRRSAAAQHLAGIAESLGSQLGVLEHLVCDARENLDKPGVSLLPAESNVQDWRELARTLLTKEHGWRKPGGVNKNLGFPAGSELKSQFVSILESLSSDERLRDQADGGEEHTVLEGVPARANVRREAGEAQVLKTFFFGKAQHICSTAHTSINSYSSPQADATPRQRG